MVIPIPTESLLIHKTFKKNCRKNCSSPTIISILLERTPQFHSFSSFFFISSWLGNKCVNKLYGRELDKLERYANFYQIFTYTIHTKALHIQYEFSTQCDCMRDAENEWKYENCSTCPIYTMCIKCGTVKRIILRIVTVQFCSTKKILLIFVEIVQY